MQLLDRIQGFLGKHRALARDRSGAPADLELEAATAILLIEAAFGDTEYVWREQSAIVRGLEREFGLGRREIQELLGRAHEIRPPVVTLADVTEVIRERYSEEQRFEVMRLIWSVIHADAVVEEWEEAFADHVAGAVGVSSARAREARTGART